MESYLNDPKTLGEYMDLEDQREIWRMEINYQTKEAEARGIDLTVKSLAIEMLKEKLPLKTITKITKLSKEKLLQLAKDNSINV